jgi:hypothetical protein
MSAEPARQKSFNSRPAAPRLAAVGASLSDVSTGDLCEELLERAAQRGAELALAQLPEPTTGQVWFDVKQATTYTGLSEDAIRAAYKSGQLRRRTRGEGSVSFHVRDLDAYMGDSA